MCSNNTFLNAGQSNGKAISVLCEPPPFARKRVCSPQTICNQWKGAQKSNSNIILLPLPWKQRMDTMGSSDAWPKSLERDGINLWNDPCVEGSSRCYSLLAPWTFVAVRNLDATYPISLVFLSSEHLLRSCLLIEGMGRSLLSNKTLYDTPGWAPG